MRNTTDNIIKMANATRLALVAAIVAASINPLANAAELNIAMAEPAATTDQREIDVEKTAIDWNTELRAALVKEVQEDLTRRLRTDFSAALKSDAS